MSRETCIITDKELDLFKMTSTELLLHLRKLLEKSCHGKVKSGDSFVYATGRIPVLLVAHVDTVHKSPLKEIFYDQAKGVLWSPDGLGSDDRAGVLGILRLLEKGYRPHVLFTDGEERGCVGALEVLESVQDPGVLFVVELDRSNGEEAVFYGCENGAFKEYITGFGFKEAEGIYTDISVICPVWNVAGVNLSCGYYNAHTKMEYMKLPELCYTLDRVERMFENTPAKRFKYWSHVPKKMLPRRSTKYVHGSCWWATAGEAAWELTRGSEVSRSYSQHCTYQETLLVVVVDPEEVASMYGGTPEMWAGWLKDHADVLKDTADDAVWDVIRDSAVYDMSTVIGRN